MKRKIKDKWKGQDKGHKGKGHRGKGKTNSAEKKLATELRPESRQRYEQSPIERLEQQKTFEWECGWWPDLRAGRQPGNCGARQTFEEETEETVMFRTKETKQFYTFE